MPCPVHSRPAWGRPDEKPDRIRGRKLQALRKSLFARQPLCQSCEAQGFLTMATIRDHIRPLAEGGTDTDDNIQALCQACSDTKTAGESLRGIRRAR